MHETPADLVALQDLLDRSAAGAGGHLRSIITPERRLTAQEVCYARIDADRMFTFHMSQATTSAPGDS